MKLARNSIDSLLSSLIPLIVAVVCIPPLVWNIGAERYGILTIAWLVLGYFGAADFGIGRAITQRISVMKSEGRAQRADAVWSALMSMTGLSLINAVILYVFASWYFSGPFQLGDSLREEAIGSIWLLAISNPIVAISGVLSGSLMGLEKFRLVSISNIISRSSLILFPLAASYYNNFDVTTLIFASLAARLLGAIILLGAVWSTFLRGESPRFSKSEFGRIANFGAWIMISSLVGPMMVYADRFLIGAWLDAAAVAAYAIAFDIAIRTLVFPLSVTQALFPRFAAEDELQSRERCRQFVVFIGQVFTPVIVVLVCMANPLMSLWLGAALDPRSILLAQIILVGCWANGLANVPYALIQARGDPRFTAILHVAELPIFILFLALFGFLFGLPGFALAFCLRCFLDCFLLLKRAGAVDRVTLFNIGIPMTLLALSMIIGTQLTNFWILLATALTLCLLSVLNVLFQMPAQIRAGLLLFPLLGPLMHRFAGRNAIK